MRKKLIVAICASAVLATLFAKLDMSYAYGMLQTWNIQQPLNNTVHSGAIGASGMAAYGNLSYVVQVIRPDTGNVMSSAGGTSAGYSWGCTVNEPLPGWTNLPPGSNLPANLELWVGNWKVESRSIRVN